MGASVPLAGGERRLREVFPHEDVERLLAKRDAHARRLGHLSVEFGKLLQPGDPADVYEFDIDSIWVSGIREQSIRLIRVVWQRFDWTVIRTAGWDRRVGRNGTVPLQD